MIKKLLLFFLCNTFIYKLFRFYLTPEFYFQYSNRNKKIIKGRDYETRKYTWLLLHKTKNFQYKIPSEFLPFQSLELSLVPQGNPKAKLKVQLYKQNPNTKEIQILETREIFFSQLQRGKNKIEFSKVSNHNSELYLSFKLENASLLDFLFLLVRVSRVDFHFIKKIFPKIQASYFHYRPKSLYKNFKKKVQLLVLTQDEDIKNITLFSSFQEKIQTNFLPLEKITKRQLWKSDIVAIDKSLPKDKLKECLRILNFTKQPRVLLGYNQDVRNLNSLFDRVLDLHSASISETWKEFLNSILNKKLPKVAVASILYRKENSINYFLESIFQQTYPGEIEILLVDDSSPDNSLKKAQEYFAQNQHRNPNISLKILRNDRNMGNCYSRNRVIQESNSEIIFVIDPDCLMNSNFIRAHVDSHFYHNADVVIGPFNIETYGQEPFEFLAKLERDGIENFEPDLQDKINKQSFLNCITRNISYKAKILKEELFDLNLSYSSDPNSGYGWEDVELGYRLYKRCVKIHYRTDAFTVHITHPPSSGINLPNRSLKNFRRLLEKHPDFIYTARRWARETYQKILEWVKSSNLEPTKEDKEFIDKLVENFNFTNFILPKRKLKILTHRWHVPHQYELYKLGHEFHLVRNLPDKEDGFTRKWSYNQRPMPENARWVEWKDVKPKEYDLCILHFDENVIHQENSNGIHDEFWGATFWFLFRNIDLPKIAICHGTPQFYGQFNPNYNQPNLMQIIEEFRKEFIQLFGNTKVILNSYQAKREWNFPNSQVIWHGFEPAEFPLTTYQKQILTLGQNVHRPWYNGVFVQKKVQELLGELTKLETLNAPEPKYFFPENQNCYALEKYRNYINNIREYSIYFNPTLRSPMPRSRGEAMMCGLVSVSMKNHDVEMFIENGKNGFYAETPEEAAEYLKFLVQNPNETKRIGLESRKLAMDLFNYDRYLSQWTELINSFGL